MRIIRSEEYLWVDRRSDAALMCPTISSIFRSFTILRPKAQPITLLCRSKVRLALITWRHSLLIGWAAFATRKPRTLTPVSQRLSLLADLRNQRRIASNILAAYLGSKTGSKVLAGQIEVEVQRRRLGSSPVVVRLAWIHRTLRPLLVSEQVITLLNALFDAQAKAIADHGGEILKFIGDGLLSIFPIEFSRLDKCRGQERRWPQRSKPLRGSQKRQ